MVPGFEASKQTAANGTVSYHGDAELTAGLEKVRPRFFNFQAKWAIFDLKCRDRVNGMSPTECLRGYFAQSDVINLALAEEPSQQFSLMYQ